jgi:hypothetical protein
VIAHSRFVGRLQQAVDLLPRRTVEELEFVRGICEPAAST